MTTVLERETPHAVRQALAELEEPSVEFLDVQSTRWRDDAREIIRGLRLGQSRYEGRIANLEKTMREKGLFARIWDNILGIVAVSLSRLCDSPIRVFVCHILLRDISCDGIVSPRCSG